MPVRHDNADVLLHPPRQHQVQRLSDVVPDRAMGEVPGAAGPQGADWSSTPVVIEPGDLVVVQSGLMHVAGVVVSPVTTTADGPGRWWLQVNVMGTSLPQMYGESEMERITDGDSHGFCRTCFGMGKVAGGSQTCSSCGGSGRAGVQVDVARTPDSIEASVAIAPGTGADWSCELCRAAFQPA